MRLGTVDVPVGRDGDLRIAWSGALLDTANVVPAARVLDGALPPGSLAGAIVFVGATDPVLGDRVTVPGSSVPLGGREVRRSPDAGPRRRHGSPGRRRWPKEATGR